MEDYVLVYKCNHCKEKAVAFTNESDFDKLDIKQRPQNHLARVTIKGSEEGYHLCGEFRPYAVYVKYVLPEAR